jgi:hypothetical protein
MGVPWGKQKDNHCQGKEAGLPEDKRPCARLVSQALHRAVRDWQGRQESDLGA